MMCSARHMVIPLVLCVVMLALIASPVTTGEPAQDLSNERAVESGGPPPRDLPPQVRGVALGLFADDPRHDYEPQLQEIAALGSTHVAVVVTYFQDDVYATEIHADPSRTPTLRTIRDTLRTARSLGLSTLLFPYVRVDRKIQPHHWRGCIEPRDRDRWFQAYEEWIVSLASIAAQEEVAILSLGSEMSSVDIDTERWNRIIERVRAIFDGQVTYSANWDHYERVEFWDNLDLIGLTGYFELVPQDMTDPSIEQVVEGWREWHVRLMRWQSRHGRPLLLTEVGYRSNDGSAARPWRWGEGENRVDLEEQRVAYEAFTRVWSHEPRLGGVFFWNWWGEGGDNCHDYTPRRKPAEGVLRRWFSITSPSDVLHVEDSTG